MRDMIRSQAVVNQALDAVDVAHGAGVVPACGAHPRRLLAPALLTLALLAAGCVRVHPPTDPGFVATENDDDPADAARDGAAGPARVDARTDGKPGADA